MKKLMTALLAIIIAGTTFSLSACGNGKEESEHYNFIIVNATLPPVMATLVTWDSNDTSYLWYGRSNTFMSVDALSNRYSLMAEAGKVDSIGISTDAILEASNRVAALYRQNKKNTFTLYCVDYGIRAAMKIFYENRIPEANFNVVLLEDGTGSYDSFITLLNHEDGKSYLDGKIDEVKNMIEKSKDRSYVYADSDNMNRYWHETLAYATWDNVSMILQYPELVSSTHEDIQPLLYNGTASNKFNFVKKSLSQLYADLGNAQSSYRNMIIDTEAIEEILFNNDKPALVFTGTSFGGENIGLTAEANRQFEVAMDEILDKYGDDYSIAFKPHPSWPVTGNDPIRWGIAEQGGTIENWNIRKAYFAAHPEIKQLPAQTPMDILLIVYPELLVGGYSSTLYMNAKPGQVEFFVTSDAKENALAAIVGKLFVNNSFKNPVTNENPFFICPSYFLEV